MQEYKLADQLYNIDEGRIARNILVERKFSLDSVKDSIRNSVTYWFVTPRIYAPGIERLTSEILDQFCK